MIHLSSYHSNGLPMVVWANKVNLIGEKVYKPKIHFCEYCNKPILIYGRLIPCKHVFCFSCATLCLTSNCNNNTINTPPSPTNKLVDLPAKNNNNNNANNNNNNNNRNDSDLSYSPKDSNNGSSMILEDSNQTPSTTPLDNANNSPNPAQLAKPKGCHRCGNKALRVERNTLNSIFVCQIESCRRTYLSAKDLQAHFSHRHSRHNKNYNVLASGSKQAISSSPYISSSSLLHLNPPSGSGPSTTNNHNNAKNSANMNSNANNTPFKRDNHAPPPPPPLSDLRDRRPAGGQPGQGRNRNQDQDRRQQRLRDRFRERERDTYQRERERERNSKEYHRQSLQRAAQWAEASAQMLEKGLSR